MMFFGVLAVVLVTGVVAPDRECPDKCSTEDRREVQKGWNGMWKPSYAYRKIALGQALFKDLFEAHPETKELFKRVDGDNLDSPKFKAHSLRIIYALDGLINLLDDPYTFVKALEHLNQQHLDRTGVKKEYFKFLQEAFMRHLPKIWECFTPTAWTNCFDRNLYILTKGLP